MSNFTDAWNAAYEGLPADNENINQGASRIRALKVDVRERMAVDHAWDDGLTTGSNDGKHNQATLIPLAGAPALDATNGAVYAAVIAGVTELFYKDSAGHVIQLTSGGQINLVTIGNAVIGGNLSVAGIATMESSEVVNGNLTVLGTSLLASLTVSANAAVDGILAANGTFIAQAAAEFNAGIGPINGNANFFITTDGSGHAEMSMGVSGAVIKFNPSVPQFEFYIANALVGHIP